jgi:hypothetical protein
METKKHFSKITPLRSPLGVSVSLCLNFRAFRVFRGETLLDKELESLAPDCHNITGGSGYETNFRQPLNRPGGHLLPIRWGEGWDEVSCPTPAGSASIMLLMTFMKKLNCMRWIIVLGLLLGAQAFAADTARVPKWDRFEVALESSATYANPVQEAKLEGTFVSPKGEKIKALGFWDGNKTWRIRFSPNQTGEWTFETTCSDTANNGLHGHKGGFICTVPSEKTRFTQHGPIRVSPDSRYFVHEDGTPFFWLSDAAANLMLSSTSENWDLYVKERSRQKFTAVEFVATQWRGAPDGDTKKELAYTGPSDRIVINPAFFQTLDKKIDALNQAGILSVVGTVTTGLAEDQAILLGRYMLARWGANHVSWVLGGETDYRGDKAEKAKRMGAAIFNVPHGPVTLIPGNMQWAWNDFKDESWFDFVGYQSGQDQDDKTFRWLIQGDVAEDWMKLPHRPFINLEPLYENTLAQSNKTVAPEAVRRSIYWSLLVSPTAGVTYAGRGPWSIDSAAPGPWDKTLKSPVAEQMTNVYNFFTSIDYWRLRPTPVFVVNQPGKDKPSHYLAAARTDNKDLMIVYVPEDRTVEVKLDSLPPAPNVNWFNPRTGETSPAVGVVTTDTCQFPTPAEGDWLLVIKSGK